MPIKAIVFDLYGTLYDVQSVARACEAACPGQGDAMARLWRQKQLEYTWLRTLMARYADFETVTEDALRFACAQFNVSLDAAARKRLADTYLRLDPHPDMPATLRRLKASGLPLGIISNGSRNSIAHVIAHSGMEWAFEQLISVEEVQAFKPHPQVYELAEQRMGHPRANIAFISANAWDASAASLSGFPVCWINRGNAPFDELGATPAKTAADLAQMADWVLSRS